MLTATASQQPSIRKSEASLDASTGPVIRWLLIALGDTHTDRQQHSQQHEHHKDHLSGSDVVSVFSWSTYTCKTIPPQLLMVQSVHCAAVDLLAAWSVMEDIRNMTALTMSRVSSSPTRSAHAGTSFVKWIQHMSEQAQFAMAGRITTPSGTLSPVLVGFDTMPHSHPQPVQQQLGGDVIAFARGGMEAVSFLRLRTLLEKPIADMCRQHKVTGLDLTTYGATFAMACVLARVSHRREEQAHHRTLKGKNDEFRSHAAVGISALAATDFVVEDFVSLRGPHEISGKSAQHVVHVHDEEVPARLPTIIGCLGTLTRLKFHLASLLRLNTAAGESMLTHDQHGHRHRHGHGREHERGQEHVHGQRQVSIDALLSWVKSMIRQAPLFQAEKNCVQVTDPISEGDIPLRGQFRYLGTSPSLTEHCFVHKNVPARESGTGRGQKRLVQLEGLISLASSSEINCFWSCISHDSAAVQQARRTTQEELGFSSGLLLNQLSEKLVVLAADSFRLALTALTHSPGANCSGGCFMEDFPLIRGAHSTDQDPDQTATLRALLGGGGNVEDAYPLTPLQAGMLFHTMLAPESAQYFLQTAAFWEGKQELHTHMLKRAVELVVEQHTILRTAFDMRVMAQPLQVVLRQVKVPWRECSWEWRHRRNRSALLPEFLQQDRRQGFRRLNEAPLMRFVVGSGAEENDGAPIVILDFHHALIDGWSLPILFSSLNSTYSVLARRIQVGSSAPQSPSLDVAFSFRHFIEWLQQQDVNTALAFWKDALRGFTDPTLVATFDGASAPSAASAADPLFTTAEQHVAVSQETVTAVKSFCRQHRVTANTIVQGVWSLALSAFCQQNPTDVVFGSITSGRTVSLAGIEHALGVFINTLPTRVNIQTDKPLIAWLAELQTAQVEARQYDYVGLAQIHSCCAHIPKTSTLFDSIQVFENYPTTLTEALLVPNEVGQRSSSEDQLQFRVDEAAEKTNYPVSVQASPPLSIGIMYAVRVVPHQVVARLVAFMSDVLQAIDIKETENTKYVLTKARHHIHMQEERLDGEAKQLSKEWNDTEFVWHLTMTNEANGTTSSFARRSGHDRAEEIRRRSESTTPPQNTTVTCFFETRVGKCPDSIAAVLDDDHVAFRELLRRSDALSNALLHGAGLSLDRQHAS